MKPVQDIKAKKILHALFWQRKFSTYFIEKNKSKGTIRKILGLLDGVYAPPPMTTDGA